MRLAKHRELIEAKSADVALLTIQGAVELMDRKPTFSGSEKLDDIEAAAVALEAELVDASSCRKQLDPLTAALLIHKHGGMFAAARKLTDVMASLKRRLDLIDQETDIQLIQRTPPLTERVVALSHNVGGLCVANAAVLLQHFKQSNSKEAKVALRAAMDK
ncbi:hypothetical protein [Sinorhizobium meliloti]|uniref:hypothetical protein n=1 Tax=Rhizobium meliloti TaxID=382 RepID=UPI00299E0138|nr:hypothetical protein [Sinorhizobium meliloti]